MIGNKSDMTEQREVPFNEAAQFAKDNGLIFVETSAKRSGRSAPWPPGVVGTGALTAGRARAWTQAAAGRLAAPSSGENVEEAFIDTARKIYENIQNGVLDLNAAESGVQKKSSVPVTEKQAAGGSAGASGCNC